MRNFYAIILALLCLTCLSSSVRCQTIPNSKLTPGAISSATAAQLCDPSFHTGAVRNVTLKEKREVCDTYEAKSCPGQSWELDHLISLEVGGANVPANLWPQPIAEARKKDVIENALHKFVCAAPAAKQPARLKQAQHCLSTDWRTCAAVLGQ